jgi:predicted aldo/keto reductase-like oxidoreductase
MWRRPYALRRRLAAEGATASAIETCPRSAAEVTPSPEDTMPNHRLNRRDFLSTTAKAVAATAGAGLAASALPAGAADPAPPDILNCEPGMTYRRLGKTGLMLSEVSLGGHWRTREGARYWGDFPGDVPPADVQRDREDVVGRAIDLGVNYVDITTPAEATVYGTVLRALGERMYVGYSDYILCIRNPANRTPDRIMFEIDEGLRRLKMDCMDIFRPQALTDGNHTDAEIETVVETAMKAKEQGKIRHLGMSSHSREFHMRVMEKFPEFEMLIFPYTPVSEPDELHGVFPLAKEKDVGIVTIKPFAGGAVFRAAKRKGEVVDNMEIAALSVKKIIANEYLTVTVLGMTTIDELENNLSVRTQPRRLSDTEHERLGKAFGEAFANLPPEYEFLREWVHAV